MKRLTDCIIIVFMCILLLLSLTDCCSNDSSREDGSTQESALEADIATYPEPDISCENRYTIQEAMEEATLVAVVRIDDYLERYQIPDKSFFRCTIQKILYSTQDYEKRYDGRTTGEAFHHICVMQYGGTDGELEGFPLFRIGEELLLFLKSQAISNPDLNPSFNVIGKFTGVFDVMESYNGKVYFLDRYGVLGSSIDSITNYIKEKTLSDELIKKMRDKDPLGKTHSYQYIFLQEDFTDLVNNY